MTLSSIFKSSLRPSWKFSARGVVWRLTASDGSYLVGEDRNVAEKSVSFFCCDARTGENMWRDVRFNEAWWIGIETVHRDVVFLHEYAMPDLPGHKKIHALEVKSGKVLWFDDELEYLFANGEFVYASKSTGDGRMFYKLGLRDGEIRQEMTFEAVEAVRGSLQDPSVRVEQPVPLEGFDPAVSLAVARVTAKARSPKGVAGIDTGNVVVVSFHESLGRSAEGERIQQQIAIVDRRTSRVLYRDILTSSTAAAPMPSAGTFFWMGNFLYYVKDNKMLIGLQLTTGE